MLDKGKQKGKNNFKGKKTHTPDGQGGPLAACTGCGKMSQKAGYHMWDFKKKPCCFLLFSRSCRCGVQSKVESLSMQQKEKQNCTSSPRRAETGVGIVRLWIFHERCVIERWAGRVPRFPAKEKSEGGRNG